MIAYRLKFSKTGDIKFIGHLDLLNVFHKTIKRMDIDIAYSQGFNPHQLTYFAIPLSLGYESIAEYLDIILNSLIDENELLKLFNDELPKGLKVLKSKKLEEGSKLGMAAIEAASYNIYFDEPQVSEKEIEDFFNQETIFQEKKTKKRTFDYDIKEDLIKIEKMDKGIYYKTIYNNQRNIKTELLLKALSKFLNKEIKNFKVERLEIYTKKDDKIVSMID